jgi:holliday junction DNA helicase RuvA
MTVQGIGAKASMAILGTLGADGVSRAIALGDWSAVKAAPGVGPKIAQRVVNELRDKAPAVMAMGGGDLPDRWSSPRARPRDRREAPPRRAAAQFGPGRGALGAHEPRLRPVRRGLGRGAGGGGGARGRDTRR